MCQTFCKPVDCSPPGSSCPWNFSGKNIQVGCHFLLQGIFPTQESNMHLLCLCTGSWALHHWAAGVTAFTNVDLYSAWTPPLCPGSVSLSVFAPKWNATPRAPLLSEAALLTERRAIYVTVFCCMCSKLFLGSLFLVDDLWFFSISFYLHFP